LLKFLCVKNVIEKQRNETRWEPKGNEQGHREDYEASSRGRSRQMSAHNILWGRLQEFVSVRRHFVMSL